jgi:hypothetical protein
MPLHAQSPGGKESAIHTLHRAFAQHPPGRAATRAGNVIIEAVQERLDAPGGELSRGGAFAPAVSARNPDRASLRMTGKKSPRMTGRKRGDDDGTDETATWR